MIYAQPAANTAIIEENETLQAQVKELEEILALQEEELELLREEAAETTALRSQLDLRLEELVSMQNLLGKQQRKTGRTEQREADFAGRTYRQHPPAAATNGY